MVKWKEVRESVQQDLEGLGSLQRDWVKIAGSYQAGPSQKLMLASQGEE